MQQSIILTGWPLKPTDEWYPWLKTELENKNHHVFVPNLPTMLTKKPNMSKMIQYLGKKYTFSNQTNIIGHSLGTVLGMRLAETHKFNNLILVAGFDFDDLTTELESFWPNKLNHSKIISNTKSRFVFSSDNDPYVTEYISKEMSKRLKADFILIKNAGHFMKRDGIAQIPQLLSLL